MDSFFLHDMREKAIKNRWHLVLPEGDELRTLRAASIIAEQRIAAVTLLGNKKNIQETARQEGITIPSIQIIDPADASPQQKMYTDEYYRLRKHKGLTEKDAYQKIQEPLYFAAMMAHLGHADAMVAGARSTTASVLRAALQVIGTASDTQLVSSCFVIHLPNSQWGVDGHMIFADCAIIPEPDAEQLAEIAIASAKSCTVLLNTKARIAMLSFSTHGSAQHKVLDKIQKATALIQKRMPNLCVDGELQLDAAVVPSIAAAKAPDSTVKGMANTLIFPDLNAGNIGYKLVQRFADAKAYGPFLQGFAKPVSDLSRGCSVQDIVATATVTLAMVN